MRVEILLTFKNNDDSQRKLKLYIHSLSLSKLLEYGL